MNLIHVPEADRPGPGAARVRTTTHGPGYDIEAWQAATEVRGRAGRPEKGRRSRRLRRRPSRPADPAARDWAAWRLPRSRPLRRRLIAVQRRIREALSAQPAGPMGRQRVAGEGRDLLGASSSIRVRATCAVGSRARSGLAASPRRWRPRGRGHAAGRVDRAHRSRAHLVLVRCLRQHQRSGRRTRCVRCRCVHDRRDRQPLMSAGVRRGRVRAGPVRCATGCRMECRRPSVRRGTRADHRRPAPVRLRAAGR